MSKPLVYVLDPYHVDALAALQKSSTIEALVPPESNERDWYQDATAVMIRSERRLGESDFVKAKTLKLVLKQGVGVDNIDLDAAKRHGIMVYNTPALNSEAVAELTITMALCVARRVCELDGRARKGQKLIRSKVLGRSLFQKTVGIVGMGNIGRIVAKKWMAAMEGSIVAYDPYAQENAWEHMPHKRVHKLEELLSVSDVVTLHVPLTTDTRGLIGQKELALMKPEAILVNCARGGIVDEKALLEALKSEQIFGAALDAMDVEPPTLEAYENGLFQCQNIIMTPHVGAGTYENQIRSGIAVVETLLAVLEGREAVGRQV